MAGNSAAGRSEGDAGAHGEPHHESIGSRLNWLRAGVLGANDGIVSTASLVVGVAGAVVSSSAAVIAGVAGLFAGATSMASGEYVSVSSQRDTERAMLRQERRELRETPGEELDELTELYRGRGLGGRLAREVAEALTAHDALAAHAEVELGIDPKDLTNPWQAAMASFLSFTAGAVLPLLAIGFSPHVLRVPITVVCMIAALALTGTISAALGSAPYGRAIVRNVIGGAVAMGVTYGVGTLIGQAVG